jgi:rubrerythrin
MVISSKFVEAKDAFRRLIKEEKKHLIDLQTRLLEYKKRQA